MVQRDRHHARCHRDRPPRPRHHVRHHHGRNRPLDRHRHDTLRRDDRRVPHLLGPAAVARSHPRDPLRRDARRDQRRQRRGAEDPALHRDARDDARCGRALARDLGYCADLLQGDARLRAGRDGIAHSRHPLPERCAHLHRRRHHRGRRAQEDPPRPLHVLDRLERGGDGALGRERDGVEDRDLHVRGSLHRTRGA